MISCVRHLRFLYDAALHLNSLRESSRKSSYGVFPVNDQQPNAAPLYEGKKQDFDHANGQQSYEEEMDYPLNKRILVVCLVSFIFLFVFISVAGRRFTKTVVKYVAF